MDNSVGMFNNQGMLTSIMLIPRDSESLSCILLTVFKAPSPSPGTSFHPNEADSSNHNLHDELFQLEPYDDWGSTPLSPLRDLNGNIVKCANKLVYLDFDLPARIPIKPEPHLLQYYTDRLDPRIGTRDLFLRMHPGPGEKLLDPNTLNMQKKRFRKELNIARWLRSTKLPALDEVLEKEQIP